MNDFRILTFHMQTKEWSEILVSPSKRVYEWSEGQANSGRLARSREALPRQVIGATVSS
jgi:hypothetical protein